MTDHTTSAVPQQYSLFGDTAPLRNQDDVESLPESARELVDVIGLESAIDLIKAYGGDDIKIPSIINGRSIVWVILVETIGPESASKLVERYKGTMLFVPKCHAALIMHRDREIIRRFDAGVPFDTLRREHNFSRRHLYRVLKKSL